jgi:hypothetical protein
MQLSNSSKAWISWMLGSKNYTRNYSKNSFPHSDGHNLVSLVYQVSDVFAGRHLNAVKQYLNLELGKFLAKFLTRK